MTRAIVFDEYGGPEVLRLAELPDPEPGPGQVRIRVRAAGVQPADYKLRSGAWRSWAPVTFPGRLGTEAAGVIDAVGPDVAGFAVGDEVLGPLRGAYADLVVAPAKMLALKPGALTWSEAGALAASGQTASTVLEDLAVKPGETVLVNAAAGGVGLMAVQVAVARGVHVVGTAREANHDLLRELGAVPVAYGPGVADRVRAAAPQGVDAALDAAGGDALEACVEAVGDRSRVVTIVDQAAAARFGVRMVSSRPSGSRLAELVAMAAAGEVRVFVSKQFPLERAADAHREIEGRHVRGKIVLVP
jgi:enoyl reductase